MLPVNFTNYSIYNIVNWHPTMCIKKLFKYKLVDIKTIFNNELLVI